MGSVVFENLTDEARSRLPRYPMPVLHVGQLAADSSLQGRGIGSLLLKCAAERAIEASETVGCFAIEPIADSDQAFDWYLGRGFSSLNPGSMRLYQGIETLKATVEKA